MGAPTLPGHTVAEFGKLGHAGAPLAKRHAVFLERFLQKP